ncbi:NAD(P)-dependent oxidoreductase [Sphingomonas sp.]|jgi:3-hydroxyisobutyrate dehydrogenase-like beta-hydroxyacid dehydrogenase|uniref:NAD(P)-dependent oxidoreductase n=1 Tax=Sphingomonas sp. TaxID=28214 RepID=UPI0035C7ABF1
MEVGFIGLGAMGSAMASNLLRAGHAVRGWNRSGSAGIDGILMVPDPADAFQAEVVFTMLSDDAAVREVLIEPGVLAKARPNAVHVVTATISVELVRELIAAHEEAKLGYVSAPVLGRPDAAASAQLNILTGGKAPAVEKARPLLEVLGRKLWHMGDDPVQANAAKIAVNMMITMAIEAMAEAVVLTESTGLDRGTFFDLILNTLFGSRSYESYSAHIAAGEYEPGFKARLGLKDLRLAAALAGETDRSLPMLDAVRARMAETVDAGMGESDWSAMADFTINRSEKPS